MINCIVHVHNYIHVYDVDNVWKLRKNSYVHLHLTVKKDKIDPLKILFGFLSCILGIICINTMTEKSNGNSV